MPGKVFEEVVEIARDQHGYVQTSDLVQAGIDPKRLVDYKERGLAEHRARGLYRINFVPLDGKAEFMEAALWPDGRGALSHETALDLWGLCDVNPNHIDITVPRTYRTHREVPPRYRLHFENLQADERTELDGLPIVTPAIAIGQAMHMEFRPTLIEQAVTTARDQALIKLDTARRFREMLQKHDG